MSEEQLAMFGDPDEFTLAAIEWEGMPEYKQEDTQSWKSITVHFGSEAALRDFAEKVGQPKMTLKTRFIWHPQVDPTDFSTMRYAEEGQP